MNPNSSHQLWSKWTIFITPPSLSLQPHIEDIKLNTARCLRKLFGTTGQCKISRLPIPDGRWVVEVMVDSHFHPLDRDSFNEVANAITSFYKTGFGADTHVRVDSKLLAGERLDGKPADQMLVVPTLGT